MSQVTRYEMYQDEDGDWRWRLRAVNGAIIACSGEGYTNLGDCLHAIGLVKNSGGAIVENLDA